MRTLSTKQAFLAAALTILMSSTAYANDMIKNNASGFIEGSVDQESNGQDFLQKPMDIAVGAIRADRAEDNKAQGYVRGSVSQDAYLGTAGAPVLHVGSITAEEAISNEADGFVDGDVFQVGDVKAEIGSIESEGQAWGNKADGSVGGHISQNGYYTPARLSVGSIGPRE